MSLFDEMSKNVIYEETFEMNIEDGVFEEVTEKLKDIITWRTIISIGLMSGINKLNQTEEEKTMMIQEVAYVFAWTVKTNKEKNNDERLYFKCKLDKEVKTEAREIVSAINFSKNGEPVLTFFFPHED